MKKLILSKEAVKDINSIFDYTSVNFGKNQALNYLKGIKKILETIENNPLIGKKRDEIKKNLQSFPFKSHLIFYTVQKNKIRIIRILYGGRDIIKILK